MNHDSYIAYDDLRYLVQTALPRQIEYERSACLNLFNSRHKHPCLADDIHAAFIVHRRMLRSREYRLMELESELKRRERQ